MTSSLDKIRHKYKLGLSKFRVSLGRKDKIVLVQYQPFHGCYHCWNLDGTKSTDRNCDFPGWIYVPKSEDLYLPAWF